MYSDENKDGLVSVLDMKKFEKFCMSGLRQNGPRLAFCMQNRSFRLYSNTAVAPQKVFDKAILHEVHLIIDAKWRTNFYLHKSQ